MGGGHSGLPELVELELALLEDVDVLAVLDEDVDAFELLLTTLEAVTVVVVALIPGDHEKQRVVPQSRDTVPVEASAPPCPLVSRAC
jgi:hypothetical protein